jgi:plastocyanin
VFTSVAVAPASPSVSVGLTTTLTAIAKDQSGANFGGAPAASWTSSNTAAATVDPATGVVTGVANGNSTITASITAGSVTHTGSQQVSVVTPSATGSVTATGNQVFDPHTVTIARASGTGAVTWTFESLAHTVTWDSQPGSVTDIDLTHDADVSRTFTVPGTYNYHCSIHPNMTGVVIVQ